MGEAEGEVRGDLTALLEALVKAPAPEGAWAEELRPGDVLDRFEVLRELGRGGFGAVYEAFDTELQRRVALKTLRPGRARDEWADAAIRAEAQSAARLSHPGIVTLFEACTCEKGPYLVLELLQGETLEERLGRGALPPGDALEIGLQAARALAHAHAQGLVHRDLKPGNLHLGEDGRVKLLDLGLAHLLGGKAKAGGTPAYVAPEQWRGEPVDGKADVFSLGVVLFEMLSGRRPFEVKEGRSGALDGAAPAPLPAPLPRRLRELLARCLAPRPAARPTAAQVAEELRGLQQASARPGPHRRLALLAAAGVAAGALLAGLAFWRLAPRSPPAGPDGRIVVAVADFANETRDPDLDGLSDLLVTSLEQSRKLRVLTRSRMVDVLRQLGKTGVERIDEPLSREVGRREGVRALFHASVRRLGEIYAVDLRALDPQSDHYLFAVREQTQGKEGIFALVDRLSERARRELAEPGAEVRGSEVKLAEAATASPEAWRHYAEGLRHRDQGRLDSAVAEWREALRIDPRFALAHLQLVYLGEFAGVAVPERRAALELALSQVDRLPHRDRLLAEAWKARMEGRFEEALAGLARAADDYPQDKQIAYMAGTAAYSAGKPGAALPWFERAVALDPAWAQAQRGAVTALWASGKERLAVERARSWAQAAPGADSLRILVWALQLAGEPGEAAAVAPRILEWDGGAVARTLVADALVRADRGEEAEALVRPLVGPGAPPEVDFALAEILSAQGRRREALEIVDRSTEPGRRAWGRLLLLQGDRDPQAARRAAREALRLGIFPQNLTGSAFHLGDLDLAAEAAAALPAGPGDKRAYHEALLRWSRGEREQALAALRALSGGSPLGTQRHWWRARVAFELGLVEEGEAAVRAFEREPASLWRGWGRAQVLLWQAEAHARRGERELALAVLDRLERSLKRADPDMAQLLDARALRKRLAVR